MSKDGGISWSAPIRVNDDNSNRHQFFTWMDIDQTDGHLYFVFYDRRAHSDNQTDVYLAISSDGGASFINRKISETPFIPAKGVFFGDYTNITVHNGIVRPIWTRFENGNLSIWTNITPLSKLLSTPPIETEESAQHLFTPILPIISLIFPLNSTKHPSLNLSSSINLERLLRCLLTIKVWIMESTLFPLIRRLCILAKARTIIDFPLTDNGKLLRLF